MIHCNSVSPNRMHCCELDLNHPDENHRAELFSGGYLFWRTGNDKMTTGDKPWTTVSESYSNKTP